MTTNHLAGHRFDRGRLWLVVAIVATVAAVVLAAVASGVFRGAAPPPARRAAPSPHISATPSEVPLAAPVRTELTPMSKSVPTRLRIPAIGVDSDLISLGLKSDGTLETPPGAFPAGWFTGAPTPGELGPAIIVGHVRYVQPGVFERLTDLRRDDKIKVARRDGSTASFRVTRIEHFAKSKFPTRRIYGNIDHPGLRLITCGGLDASTNVFEENVVVFADLVGKA